MKKIDKTAIIEGIKQSIRIVLIAIIPLVIAGLQSDQLNGRAILIAGVIALLSGIDKGLHEKKIETPLDLKFIK